MSDNIIATDTIKEMVRARYGGIAASADLVMLRAGGDDILLRHQRGARARPEREGDGISATRMKNSRPCRRAPISDWAAAIPSPSRR